MSPKELLFDDIYVGQEFPGLEYHLNRETIQKYGEAVEDLDPIYTDQEAAVASEFGGPVAHPTTASIYILKAYKVGVTSPPGGVHAKQKFEFISPTRPGETLQIKAKVVDKYIKRERRYVVIESLAVNQDGEPKVKSLMTVIWAK